MQETIINWVIITLNIIGFILMGEDKRRAKRHQYRIPERTLWILAIAGGAAAMTIGMKLYHHKTKHTAFKIGFPFLAILQIALYVYFFV